MAPFYVYGSTASGQEPLQGGTLLFTTKFPEIPSPHFIDLGRMKGVYRFSYSKVFAVEKKC